MTLSVRRGWGDEELLASLRQQHFQCGEGVGPPHGVSSSLWMLRAIPGWVGPPHGVSGAPGRMEAWMIRRARADSRLIQSWVASSVGARHRRFIALLGTKPRVICSHTTRDGMPCGANLPHWRHFHSMRARRGTILEVKISDGTGTLLLTFFNQAWRAAELSPGVRGIFAGRVSVYQGARQLAHPDYQLFTDADASAARGEPTAEMKRWAETPIPIYSSTASIASWQIQKMVEL